jgi:hypothetical protein
MTTKERQTEGHIKETACNFIDQVNLAIMEKQLEDSEIKDRDQSQFSCEMSSTRTLYLQDGRDTSAIADTSSSLTYS